VAYKNGETRLIVCTKRDETLQNMVMMLTRGDWTKGIETPPLVKGLVWFTDGSKIKWGGGGLGSLGNL
jgi:hypothetical protein